MLAAEKIVDRLLEGDQLEIDFPYRDGEDPQTIDPKEIIGGVSWMADPKEFVYVKEKEPPSPPWGIVVDKYDNFYFKVLWKRQINPLTRKPQYIGEISASYEESDTPVWRIVQIPTHMGFFGNDFSERTFTSRFGCARELLRMHKAELAKAKTLDRVMRGY